jgi:hypothetical protein
MYSKFHLHGFWHSKVDRGTDTQTEPWSHMPSCFPIGRKVGKLQKSTQSGSDFVPTNIQIFTPSPYLKASSNKIKIEKKLVGVHDLYCTKFHLRTWSDSWVISIK